MHVRKTPEGTLDLKYCEQTIQAGDYLGIDVFCISDLELTGDLRFVFEREPGGRIWVQDQQPPGQRFEFQQSQPPMDFVIISRVFDSRTGQAIMTAAGKMRGFGISGLTLSPCHPHTRSFPEGRHIPFENKSAATPL